MGPGDRDRRSAILGVQIMKAMVRTFQNCRNRITRSEIRVHGVSDSNVICFCLKGMENRKGMVWALVQ